MCLFVCYVALILSN